MPLPEAILGTRQLGAEMGTGTVVSVSATTLQVLARGTVIVAAYLARYVTPVVGDLVAFVRQDSTWLVLDRLAGVGANAVLNFSFEDDGDSPFVPSNWTLYNIAGVGTAHPSNTGFAPAGIFELAVSSNGAVQDTYVYSAPIPVAPGQQWALSALASAVYPTATLNANAALYALWFANNTNLYPTTSSADTLVAQANNINAEPIHTSLSGTVTVPAATNFLRVATRAISPAAEVVLFDVVIARRVA
jgi:hypothetical protein